MILDTGAQKPVTNWADIALGSPGASGPTPIRLPVRWALEAPYLRCSPCDLCLWRRLQPASESTFIHLRNLLMTVALMGPTAPLVRIERESSVVISHALNRALQFG